MPKFYFLSSDFDQNPELAITAKLGSLIIKTAGEEDHAYQIDELETLEFRPDSQFITRSVDASRQAQERLDNARQEDKAIFMVTGLKVATGFRLWAKVDSSTHPRITLPYLIWGRDVTSNLEISKTTGWTTQYGPVKNKVIFAMRVVKITRGDDGSYVSNDEDGGQFAKDSKQKGAAAGLEVAQVDEGMRDREFGAYSLWLE
ncbi:hypothetical protein BO94DRAFT_584909 [Aspergillus sclerotioniger CBS 115572]|uniref:Uncharacterized protein n=1 Tax=Aspergillus sclerotioniger CBS 115572 TaxID=1450535 RepID=A0A317WWU8_9EURO|nr:hypothetical protein BO94DRAFT_584909 [Aspergillus sclerotioniger CBS 115572]PWY89667.1 hypothetical protein BO94DRAFT_584909 [Aspergillus sclerotioniger CBS 115572]